MLSAHHVVEQQQMVSLFHLRALHPLPACMMLGSLHRSQVQVAWARVVEQPLMAETKGAKILGS